MHIVILTENKKYYGDIILKSNKKYMVGRGSSWTIFKKQDFL